MTANIHVKDKAVAERFGRALRLLRERSGMTLQDVAKRIGETGKCGHGCNTVGQWENGTRMPIPAKRAALANLFRVSVYDMLSGRIK